MDDLVTDAAAADVAAVVNVDNVDTAVLEGQFTVGISYQAAVADREAFETAFKADLAALLGIEPELIAIQGLSPGSCKVDFTVLLAENHASVTGTLDEAAEALRTTLEAPMGDPTAVFHNISTSILGGEALGATQLSRSIGVKTVVPAAESEDAGANAAPDPEPDPEPEPGRRGHGHVLGIPARTPDAAGRRGPAGSRAARGIHLRGLERRAGRQRRRSGHRRGHRHRVRAVGGQLRRAGGGHGQCLRKYLLDGVDAAKMLQTGLVYLFVECPPATRSPWRWTATLRC